MVFTCTGSTFTALSLDYSTADEIIGNITAADTWSEYTNGTFHINLAGNEYEEEFTLCDTLTNSSVACGYAGAVQVDLSEMAESLFVGHNFSSLALKALITSAYIDFSAQPDGYTTEHCTKHMLTSGYGSASTTSSNMKARSTTNKSHNIVHGLLHGMIALTIVVAVVAVARYATKLAKMMSPRGQEATPYGLRPGTWMKSIRGRSGSKRSRNRSMSKNDAEEKLVDEKGELV